MSNPILQRELISTLRSPRATWALGVAVALMVSLVLLLWPSGGMYSLGEQASHTLLNSASLGGLLIALLIAPSFTATSLTMEKENKSYDLLTHTLLRAPEIAWGKVVSAQFFLLMIVLATLPVLASTLLLGGTGPKQLALIVAVIVAATVTTGLIGFMVSAWSRESFTALVITYAVTLAWTTLPLLPPLLMREMVKDMMVGDVSFFGALNYSSPLAAMIGLVEPDIFARMALPVSPKLALPIYFITCAGVSFGAWFLGTVRIVAGSHIHERRSRVGKKRRSQFPFVLIDPDRRKGLIGNWSNPVLSKELRSRTFSQAPWVIRGMYATFTVSLVLVGLMLRDGMTDSGGGMHLDVLKLAMISFQVLVVILLVPALLAGAVTQEVEQKQFDLLRQTLLKPHTFLLGKVISAWLLILLLLVASAPMWCMMAYLENFQWMGTLVSLAVVGSTLILASAVSLTTTTMARTTAISTAAAYAVVALIAFGTLVPLLMGGSLSPQWRTAVLSWNPFAAGVQVVSIEFLRDEAMLWKSFISQSLTAGLACFLIAWLLLWNKLRRES